MLSTAVYYTGNDAGVNSEVSATSEVSEYSSNQYIGSAAACFY
jgi:hypothetical protein